ncbi:hypothetical protein [Mycobacterium sp. 1245805.9]|uniref:Rv1733c family protein n=1 Tax=Mycobacterium sp. 1245805.9 TaxID=1856862 RepID=UPI0007FBCA78|nr:hypothetical protein [Mycobacterium sp. 1245805.9]OBI90093.1 hypothetical protein A9X00_02410 [Mycobacterium sp. 1245805.9]
MTTPRPDEMETLGVPARVPPLLARLLGLNPLVRTADRVEALLLVFAFVVSIVALPVAAAVGTAVHDSRSRVYAAQAQTHQKVTATVTGNSDADRKLSSARVAAPARWVVEGTERTGLVVVERNAKPGDRVDIWVDEQGMPVGKPVFSAVDEAVATGTAIWFGVVIGAAVLFGMARILIDRKRHAGWQRDFDRMVGERTAE